MIHTERGWDIIDVEETKAGDDYRRAKLRLDEVMKHSRHGYYDIEREKDPKTGLNDEQIRKELDELNK